MDVWTWIGLTVGLLCWFAVGAGIIYWINRTKRAEAEREELRDELRGVASLLAQYHNSYYGRTKETLGEIAGRLSTTSPRFTDFFTSQGVREQE
jgi:hypothetical protein